MLLEGYIYFSPVTRYRSDTTCFRGDDNEGMVPIEPSKFEMRGQFGQNIFEFLPKPNSIRYSIADDDGILMFCASMITNEIMIKDNDDNIFSEEYKTAIKDFGDHVLLFSADEFLSSLNKARQYVAPEFGYTSGPIIYRDLKDFSDPDSYQKAYNSSGSVYDPYFVKSNKYKTQNEWRLIVDGSYESLPVDDDGSYTIKIDKLDWAHLWDTATFLDTFKIKS